MRIPLDLMYQPPSLDVYRAQYAHDIRKTLINDYKIAREKLNFAHKRQKIIMIGVLVKHVLNLMNMSGYLAQ